MRIVGHGNEIAALADRIRKPTGRNPSFYSQYDCTLDAVSEAVEMCYTVRHGRFDSQYG